jgi:hypothetical protein
MAYVVALELEGGETDYRAFQSEEDARRLHALGVRLSMAACVVRRRAKADAAAVLASRLYFAEASTHAAAVAAVKAGRGIVIG